MAQTTTIMALAARTSTLVIDSDIDLGGFRLKGDNTGAIPEGDIKVTGAPAPITWPLTLNRWYPTPEWEFLNLWTDSENVAVDDDTVYGEFTTTAQFYTAPQSHALHIDLGSVKSGVLDIKSSISNGAAQIGISDDNVAWTDTALTATGITKPFTARYLRLQGVQVISGMSLKVYSARVYVDHAIYAVVPDADTAVTGFELKTLIPSPNDRIEQFVDGEWVPVSSLPDSRLTPYLIPVRSGIPTRLVMYGSYADSPPDLTANALLADAQTVAFNHGHGIR